jgi:glycosyltransferase involved in cell wall biosynthesis
VAKILWLGDAGCHTGFARVTHSIGERLVTEYGHDVHVLAVNYDGGDPWSTPLKLYVPTTKKATDIYGQSRFQELLAKIEPDAVVILNDPNIVLDLLLRNKYDPQLILLRYRPLLAYVPIDGHSHPPSWAKALHRTTKLVAMSKHGSREMTTLVQMRDGEDVVEKVPPVVYHGVDTDVYHPINNAHPVTVSSGAVVRSKREAKEVFGWSKDDFIVLRVDKNSGRKDYPATWKALVPFMHDHPNVRVHLHCQGDGLEHGLDIKSMLTRDPETSERFSLPSNLDTYTGWPESDLVALYNAADVFISTSRGEGFGLTIAEALACGTPVIAQNVSAIPEVVGPGGILIDPIREVTVPSGKDQWLANIPAFTAALEKLYQSSGARKKLGEAGRQHVVKHFSWDKAAEQFDVLLRELIEEGEKAAAALAAEQLISDGGTTDG